MQVKGTQQFDSGELKQGRCIKFRTMVQCRRLDDHLSAKQSITNVVTYRGARLYARSIDVSHDKLLTCVDIFRGI